MRLALAPSGIKCAREFDTSFQIVRYDVGSDLLTLLDTVADDNECMEIEADGLPNYCPIKDYGHVLRKIVTKLHHGGKFTITGVDVFEMYFYLDREEIDLHTFNGIIYGKQCCGINTILDTAELLKELGVKIHKKAMDRFMFTITGERP